MAAMGRHGRLREYGVSRPLVPGGDEWLDHEDALTMLVRDLAVQLEDMAGQLDEQVRIQSSHVQEVMAQLDGVHQQRADIMESMAVVASRCDSAVGSVGDSVRQLLQDSGYDEHLGALRGQVQQLEATVLGGADREGLELEALRGGQARLAAETRSQREAGEALRDAVRRAEGRVATCEDRLEELAVYAAETGGTTESLFKQLQRTTSDMQSIKASLQDRVASLEKSLEDRAALRRSQALDIEAVRERLSRDISETLEVARRSLAERVDAVERLTRESAEGLRAQAKRIDSHKARQESLSKDLRAVESAHASLAERVRSAEQSLGDRARDIELAAADAKEHRERHKGLLDAQQAAQEKLSDEVRAHADAQRATAKRVDRVTKELSEKQELHAKSMELQLASHKELLRQIQVCDERGASLEDRLRRLEAEGRADRVASAPAAAAPGDGLAAEFDAVREQLGSQEDRLRRLEAEGRAGRAAAAASTAAPGEGLAAEFHAVREQLGSQVLALDERLEVHLATLHDEVARSIAEIIQRQDLYTKSMDVQKVSASGIAERVEHLERVVGESTRAQDKHLRALEAMRSLHDRFVGDVAAWEDGHAALLDRVSAAEASSDERFADIERRFEAAFAKQDEDLESLRLSLREIAERLPDEGVWRDAQAEPGAASEVLQQQLEDLERGLWEDWGRETAALREGHESLDEAVQQLVVEVDGERQSRQQHQEFVVPILQRMDDSQMELRQQVDRLDRRVVDATQLCAKAAEDFSRETRLVWQAIDSHTHGPGGGTAVMSDAYEEGSTSSSRPPRERPRPLEGPRLDGASARSWASATASAEASPRSVRSLGALAAAARPRGALAAAAVAAPEARGPAPAAQPLRRAPPPPEEPASASAPPGSAARPPSGAGGIRLGTPRLSQAPAAWADDAASATTASAAVYSGALGEPA